MVPEKERIKHLDNAPLVRILPQDLPEELGLLTSTLSVLLRVLAEFDGNLAASLLHIDALDNLAKGASIDHPLHQVAVADLLAHLDPVITALIRYVAHALYPHTANGVDEVIS